MKPRSYLQARNLRKEAEAKIILYETVLGRVRHDYELLRQEGICCHAFFLQGQGVERIEVTRQCWNHVFKHPIKRSSKVEKLERALCFPMALKLLKKTTTYQEVSREEDTGGTMYLYYGIIGYVRGNRIKVILRKQEKNTEAKVVLFSFYQMFSQ